MLSHIPKTGAGLSKLLSYLKGFENPNKNRAGWDAAPQFSGSSLFNLFRYF